MPKQAYDLLVIGAGAAGSTAASNAAKNGTRIAMVERDSIGGTCLNYDTGGEVKKSISDRQLHDSFERRDAGLFRRFSS